MASSAVEFLNLCVLGRFVVYSIFTTVRASQKVKFYSSTALGNVSSVFGDVRFEHERMP